MANNDHHVYPARNQCQHSVIHVVSTPQQKIITEDTFSELKGEIETRTLLTVIKWIILGNRIAFIAFF